MKKKGDDRKAAPKSKRGKPLIAASLGKRARWWER
jgi:hypothetical protein